jgi:hypothetical protein
MSNKPITKKEFIQTTTDNSFERTPNEHSATDILDSNKKTTPRLRVQERDGKAIITLEAGSTAESRLMMALGTTEPGFLTGILNQLAKAASIDGKVDELRLNFLLTIVKGVEPKDQLETMLAAQMAAIHSLTMSFTHRLLNARSIPEGDSAERTLNKLARTFAAQVEALKRYRTGGEQRVTVEHVTVNQGGQAIVGNVAPGGAGPSEKARTTP